jgi:hypothetical protein
MGVAEAVVKIAGDRIFHTVIMEKRGVSGIKRRLMGSVCAEVSQAKFFLKLSN